jgi:hypothetical protein
MFALHLYIFPAGLILMLIAGSQVFFAGNIFTEDVESWNHFLSIKVSV